MRGGPTGVIVIAFTYFAKRRKHDIGVAGPCQFAQNRGCRTGAVKSMLVAMPRAGTTRLKAARRKRLSDAANTAAQLLRDLKPAPMPRDPPLMLCTLVDS